MGIISVAKELDQSVHSNFELTVSATDHGQPPLSSKIKVTVEVTVSTNSPPKFSRDEYVVEMQENMPKGTVIFSLSADSLSTVTYGIELGDPDGYFSVNPNSGVLYSLKPVDYETVQSFNLTVTATNIISSSQSADVIIHIIDVNDNAPHFEKSVYKGSILESADPGSMILGGSNSPLVILATDLDSSANSRLFYEIVEHEALRFFKIDSHTGAVRTAASLDYESMTHYNFSVKVTDSGKAKLQSLENAQVIIAIMDVNDRPPKFEKHLYSTRLLLPIYPDISVVQVKADDEDTVSDTPLTYSIIAEDGEIVFDVDPSDGLIRVTQEALSKSRYELSVQVSDGKFQTLTKVSIEVQQESDAGMQFSMDR